MSYVDENTQEIITDNRVVIKIKNNDTGESRIHRYTDFINQWINDETSTAYEYARYLIDFLNYVTFQVPISKYNNLNLLTFKNAQEFLEFKSREGVPTNRYEHIIKEFYYFYARKNMLRYVKTSDFILHKTKHGRTIESPWKGLYKKAKKKSKIISHDLEDEFIFEFINTVRQVSPLIALGVYFQIFGGLRRSEVLNLKKLDLDLKGPHGRNGIIINIEDSKFKVDSIEDALTSPKKSGRQIQPVFAIGDLLPKLYISHINKYYSPSCKALFQNKHNQPLTRKMYSYYFDKAKRKFIDKLIRSPFPNHKMYGAQLLRVDWSTHLGRGIFSNIMSDFTDNAIELAVLRRDHDLRSALTYIGNSKRTEAKVIKAMTNLYDRGTVL